MQHVDQNDTFTHLKTMKEIIDATMEMIISRHNTHPLYPYIDLKIDAITGIDYFNIDGIRDSKHIYSWIQGRGLEAISTHVAWYDSFNGYQNPHRDDLLSIAKGLASSLSSSREAQGGHLNFLLNDSPSSDKRFTMSDLFCSRGLYAYYSLNGPLDKAHQAKIYLMDVIHAVIEGNFYNDQKGFDDSQYKAYNDERTSYASHMLILGALNLMAQFEQDIRVPRLAKELISYVLDRHVNTKKKWSQLEEDTIVEWIDNKGNPAMDGECIQADPGHALEWIGLTSQLLISLKTHYSLDEEMDSWISIVVDRLSSLLKVNFLLGYSAPGGILKSIDAIRKNPLSDSMPWWSLPETMRAIILVDSLTEPDDERLGWFQTCFSAFKEFYFEPSAIPIALQTINTKGEAIAVIPATPDLDPGYHTGLSFISCYGELAKRTPLQYSGSEVELGAKIGSLLSGHVARSSPSNQILDPLHVRLALLQSPYEKLVLINADVLEFSAQWIKEITPHIASILKIDESNILISATHTHTAVSVITLGALHQDEEFLLQLKNDILTGCTNLLQSTDGVVMEVSSFTHQSGINRRLFDKKTGKTTMRPNEEGSRDDEVSVVALRNESGKVKCVWVNMAVHPTTIGVSMAVISADYPARVARVIKERIGDDVVVIPFTGACGDVRPRILTPDKTHFRDGTEFDIEQIGKEIGKKIVAILERGGRVIKSPLGGVLIRLKTRLVPITMRDIPTREELISLIETNNERLKEATIAQEHLDDFSKKHENPLFDVQMELAWAHRLLALDKISDTVIGEFSVVSFNNEVYLFSIPGELFSSVGKRIKQLVEGSTAIISGYSGGSLGYLPNEASNAEGGYEISQAFKYYGLAGPFSASLERTIISTISSLLEEIHNEH